MKGVLFIILVVYIFWMLIGRATYIRIKYRKETGIPLPAEVTREGLLKKLREELHYPTLKEIFYDEQGRIALRCKFGTHVLRMEEGRLFVGKGEIKTSTRVRAHHIEEAECLKAYIQKMFDPDAPVNPSVMYNKLKNFRRNSLILIAVIFVVFGIACVFTMDEAGMTDAVESQNISNSYLSQYSETVTVGEAFNRFFSDPEWFSYEDGAQQMVDFKGGCTYDGAPVTMIITFVVNIDTFSVQEIKVDGEKLPEITYDEVLRSIYKENISSGSSDAADEPEEPEENIVAETSTQETEIGREVSLSASTYFIKNYDSLWSFDTVEEFLDFKYGSLGHTEVYRSEDPEYGYCVNPSIYLDRDVDWTDDDYDTILWDILYATSIIEYGVDRVHWGYGYICADITEPSGTVYYMDNDDCMLYEAMDFH